eukprot:2988367-Karenia_brevis.AAC.1
MLPSVPAVRSDNSCFKVISFNAAISACEKGGPWQHVAPLLDEMWRALRFCNVISFNAVISACEK